MGVKTTWLLKERLLRVGPTFEERLRRCQVYVKVPFMASALEPLYAERAAHLVFAALSATQSRNLLLV